MASGRAANAARWSASSVVGGGPPSGPSTHGSRRSITVASTVGVELVEAPSHRGHDDLVGAPARRAARLPAGRHHESGGDDPRGRAGHDGDGRSASRSAPLAARGRMHPVLGDDRGHQVGRRHVEGEVEGQGARPAPPVRRPTRSPRRRAGSRSRRRRPSASPGRSSTPARPRRTGRRPAPRPAPAGRCRPC